MFLEDFAESQTTFGKALMKIDTQVAKSRPELETLYDFYGVINTAVVSLGMDHINLSASITQSLTKQLRDLSKDSSRKIIITSQNVHCIYIICMKISKCNSIFVFNRFKVR